MYCRPVSRPFAWVGFGSVLCAASVGRAAPPDATPPAPSAAPAAPPADVRPNSPAGAPADVTPSPSAPDAAPAPKPEAVSEVVVVGTPERQTSGSAHVVKPKQLERFEYDDAHQVLLQVPGVYVRGEDGLGLRPNVGMRGATPDRSKKITLMEDGVLFAPAPYSAPAAYYFPLVTRAASVRVVKGPSTIGYGPHTVGGAIDVVTAPVPSSRAGSVDLAAGEYGYRKAHVRVGGGDDRLGVLVEGVHLGSSGFKDLDGGGPTGFTRNEWMVKTRYVLQEAPAQHELELKLGYADEDSRETYLGLTDDDFRRAPLRRYAASGGDRMRWHRTQIELRDRLRLSPELAFDVVAYRHDLERTWQRIQGVRGASLYEVLREPQTPANAPYYDALVGRGALGAENALLVGPNQRTFVAQGVQGVVRWSPRTGPVTHRVEYGLRLHYDSIRRRHTQDPRLLEGGASLPAGEPTETTANDFDRAYAMALHAADALTYGPLTLTPGLRVEAIWARSTDRLAGGATRSAPQQVVLPGLGAFYALRRDLGLLAGVHRGFSPVPPGQAPGTEPERSTNYEAGVRYAPRRLRVEIIGFYNDYQNLTSVCGYSSGCTSGDLDRQFDAGRARVYGLETYVESELQPAAGLTLPARLAYTFTDARFLGDFSSNEPTYGDVRAGDELPYVPRHQLAASLGVETRALALNLAGTYVGSMRELAGQGEPAPRTTTDAYFVLDASASYRVLSYLSVYANGRNLLDEAAIVARRPFGARPNAPRWLQLGLKASFLGTSSGQNTCHR